MSRSGWPLSSIATGLLVLFVLAFCGSGGSTGGPTLPTTLAVGGMLGLAALTAIHFSIRKTTPAGVAVYILSLFVIGVVLAFLTMARTVLVLLLPAMIAVPVSLAIGGIKLGYGNFEQLQDSDQTFQEGLQFQISHLLIATAVFAIMCGVVKALLPHLSSSNVEINLLVIATVLAVNTLVSVWALMGRSIGWKIAVAIVIVCVVTLVGLLIAPTFQRKIGVWLGITVIPWLATVTLLALLRQEGFRFVRRPRIDV